MKPKVSYEKPNGSTLNNNDMDRLRMVVRTNKNFESISSETLYGELNDRYPNRGTFSVICYTLKKFFSETRNQKKAEFWGDAGRKLSEEVNQQELRSELTNNEIKNWKSQKEIMKIMNNIDIKNRTDYNRFLLLAMCTFQPPLRKEFYQSLRFVLDKNKVDKKCNYILLQKDPQKCYYIINFDKNSKYEKFNQVENMLVEIEQPDLVKLLWNSYEQNPREFVLETCDGKQYSMNSICIVLLERPFHLNFDILRSSYVSNFYQHNPYPLERQELARKMRHSVDIAEKSYLKRAGMVS